MLKRKIYSRIEEYLKNPSHKMLLVDGARQIGKSFIIRHIGQMLYPNYIEVNMEEDKQGDRIFANARTTKDFYLALSASRHKEIFVSSPAPHRCGGFSSKLGKRIRYAPVHAADDRRAVLADK